jgi:hypothetical protein
MGKSITTGGEWNTSLKPEPSKIGYKDFDAIDRAEFEAIVNAQAATLAAWFSSKAQQYFWTGKHFMRNRNVEENKESVRAEGIPCT